MENDIEYSSGGGSVLGLLASVVGLWALWAHSYVWGVATSFQSPLDVLAMAVAVVVFVYGAVSLIGLVLLAVALLYGVAVGIVSLVGIGKILK